VEAVNDLPPPSDFHDFHALCCLLYGHDPFQWEPDCGMDRAALIRMALAEKIIPLDSYGQFLGNAAQEHLAAVYEEIELPVIAPTLAMTLTGVPFNTDTLEQLAGREGSVATNAAALLPHVQADGRIYADLDPLGTATGRYSCSDPPLQALDRRVRRAIEAAPGCVLMEADYSQMELRVLAHFSQDAALLHAFEHGVDLHVRTAASVLNIAESDVTDQQRQLGKTLNFGIVYGQTAYGLADELGVTMPRAEELLDAHATAYPGVAAWIAAMHAQAGNVGEVRTLYGRRRCLPNIYSANEALAAEARRQAVNTVIQGSAADLMKMALIRLHDKLPDEVRMLLPVHDSLLCEVPQALVEETRRIVRNVMETTPAGFAVPLKVDIRTGRTWADCK
jgi:DNA polymerase I-like protein with 3'-5' exonuclease and polymerase domains